jgi:hypothetical protein
MAAPSGNHEQRIRFVVRPERRNARHFPRKYSTLTIVHELPALRLVLQPDAVDGLMRPLPARAEIWCLPVSRR